MAGCVLKKLHTDLIDLFQVFRVSEKTLEMLCKNLEESILFFFVFMFKNLNINKLNEQKTVKLQQSLREQTENMNEILRAKILDLM